MVFPQTYSCLYCHFYMEKQQYVLINMSELTHTLKHDAVSCTIHALPFCLFSLEVFKVPSQNRSRMQKETNKRIP